MADNAIEPGTVLAGRFRLEDLLYENAGAKHWRATDQILARNVAVHVIPSADPRAKDLLAAARTSATVTDGHFLRVLDAAEENEVAYVVNEWGTGSSLDQMLDEGTLPPRRAAWLVKEVAEAITAAHRHGVAHGRLLPENVMVTEAGSVKLIGFAVDAALTDRPGTDEADGPAADVLNLAALLYATLVGRWPGSAGSKLPDAPRENGRPLRPRQVRAGVPRPLDSICERVLNAEAYQGAGSIATAHDVCMALSDFIGDPMAMAAAQDPTVVIDGDDLPDTATTPVSGPQTEQMPDPIAVETTAPLGQGSTSAEIGGPPWSSRQAPARTDVEARGASSPDPEATHAGMPLFSDDDTSVGWSGPSQPGDVRPPERTEPEPEDRPLFAPDVSTERGASIPPPRGAGQVTGSAPEVWGPDSDDSMQPSGPDRQDTNSSGRSWLGPAAIIAAGVVLLLTVVLALGWGPGTEEPGPSVKDTASPRPSQSSAPRGPITISSVSDFDPEGDPSEENSELAPLAADGDPATAWRTSTYYDPLNLLKDGVGLMVDLGEPVAVSQVRLTLIGEPTDLELLASRQGADAPTDTTGLRQVATAAAAGTRADLELRRPVTTRYLVVWLTSLPPSEGGFQGQIAEIAPRS
ncbi:MAG: protein kinase family protein [Actinomycetota bacterium]|nr:protein kinase family protein [Actinomycetota bacterium]